MRLENWSVVFSDNDPYLHPELQTLSLCGNVFNHPRFKDGKRVTTSSIKGFDGELIMTSSGSKYELGEIDPEYEKLYPDAKNRLLNSLKKNDEKKKS